MCVGHMLSEAHNSHNYTSCNTPNGTHHAAAFQAAGPLATLTASAGALAETPARRWWHAAQMTAHQMASSANAPPWTQGLQESQQPAPLSFSNCRQQARPFHPLHQGWQASAAPAWLSADPLPSLVAETTRFLRDRTHAGRRAPRPLCSDRACIAWTVTGSNTAVVYVKVGRCSGTSLTRPMFATLTGSVAPFGPAVRVNVLLTHTTTQPYKPRTPLELAPLNPLAPPS